MGRPLVSAIIPAYDCEPYVGAAVDSALAQDLPGVEVIVVDDGSTDGTPGVLAAYGGRIRVARQENSGVSAARNAGLAMARGEYIAFLDSDDIWFREKLGVQVRALERFPALAGVFSNFKTIDRYGAVIEEDGIRRLYSIFREQGETPASLFGSRVPFETGSPAAGTVDLYHGNIFKSLFRGNFINTSSIVIRREALGAESFDASQRTQEDYDLWMRLSRRHPFGYMDIPLLSMRKRPGQLTGAGQLEEIAVKSLEIVERFSVEKELLGEREVKRRLSRKYGNLGAIYLGNGKDALAREAFRKSLGYDPRNLRPLLYLLLSVLPPGLRGGIRRGVRASRGR